jgi:putative ABC transport system permease protein
VFFDIQLDQRDGVIEILRKRNITPSETTPLVPARITALNGRTLEEIQRDSGGRTTNRWAFRREYRNTYRDSLVGSERLIAGDWWTAPRAAAALPRISMEQELAGDLGVDVGDRVTWNVQGVPIETQITSLRQVTWARFETNFFVVFEPGVIDQAPQMFVLLARADDATLRAELQRDIVRAYPNVSALDVALVQQAVDSVLTKVTLAIRFMAMFSIGSGLVILVGALTASRLQRVREAVLLKTLGASARQIRWILLTEYAAWGTLAALTGVLLAGVAGWALVTQAFDMRFDLPALPLLGVGVVVCVLTALVGFANSREVLRGTPLGVWRELSE